MYRRMHWFFKFILFVFGLFLLWEILIEVLPKSLPQRLVFNSELSGIQLQSQTWEGTVWIKGDLIYPSGATVKILPGTRVVVSRDSDQTNFDFLPWDLKSGLNTGDTYHGVLNGEYFWDESHKIHIMFGQLLAIGSKEHPIIISSNAPPGFDSPFDFNSIYVHEGIMSDVLASDYRRLEIGGGVTVRDSNFEKVAECAICIDDGSPSVINNNFNGGMRQAVWIDGASPHITDNVFLSNAGSGVVVDPSGIGAPLISHNSFLMPGKIAIDFLTGDEDQGGEISYNNIPSNTRIKVACDSKVNIVNNNLLGLISFETGGCAHTLVIGPNYWGTYKIESVLGERILKNDPNLVVLVPSLLNSIPSGTGPRK